MMADSIGSAGTETAPGAVAKSTGRRIHRGASRTFRGVLAGGLLALLAPAAWGAGGSGPAPEPGAPEGCVQSPTARCVIRLSLAAVEELTDADARAEALARIAEAQASAGEAGEARNSLSRALAAADAIDAAAYDWDKIPPEEVAFGEQARVLSLIARVQADVGETAGARETFSRAGAAADAIEPGSTRTAALFEVAKMQIAAGALPEARQTLARANLADYAWFFHDLSKLVRAQAEAGDVAGALATARTIPGDERPTERAQALAHVAAAQAAAGDEPGALVTSGEIESQHYRMEAMRHVGIARAERGDVAGAWDAVRKIKDEIWFNPRLRDDTGGRDVSIAVASVIAAIAEAHLERGEFEKAYAAIKDEGMEDELTLVEFRMASAKARIAAGHLDAARGGAEALCESDWRGRYRRQCVEMLADAAVALAAAGRAGESREMASMALDEADGVEDDSGDRSRAFVAAYTALYTALMRAGEVEAARRAFSSALAASGEMAPQTLVLTGLAWTRAGDADVARAMFSRAVAEVAQLDMVHWRAKAFAEIAFALASGRWPAADGYPGHFQ